MMECSPICIHFLWCNHLFDRFILLSQTLTPKRQEAGDLLSGRLSLEGQSRLSGADMDDYGLRMRMEKLEKYNKAMKGKIEDLQGAMEEK